MFCRRKGPTHFPRTSFGRWRQPPSHSMLLPMFLWGIFTETGVGEKYPLVVGWVGSNVRVDVSWKPCTQVCSGWGWGKPAFKNWVREARTAKPSLSVLFWVRVLLWPKRINFPCCARSPNRGHFLWWIVSHKAKKLQTVNFSFIQQFSSNFWNTTPWRFHSGNCQWLTKWRLLAEMFIGQSCQITVYTFRSQLLLQKCITENVRFLLKCTKWHW